MKHIFVFLFLILVSCSTSNKTYLCGDRACVDKKEFKEHFAKNLTIEIQSKKNKKNSSIDLVKLNLPEETLGNKKKEIACVPKDEKKVSIGSSKKSGGTQALINFKTNKGTKNKFIGVVVK